MIQPPLSPDFKTIADFRKDNLGAIKGVCREFSALCNTVYSLDFILSKVNKIELQKLVGAAS